MKKIIFVDDEPNVLNGLKRMLYTKKNVWDMRFVGSGMQALELLNDFIPDIVVSDMRMPCMSGARLLAEIKKKHPGVIRIALSGYSDLEMILESVKVTHNFIAKPANFEKLSETIDRSISIKDIVEDKELSSFISSLSSIPAMPGIYDKLQRLLACKDASLRDAAELIETDIGMTSKVLQIVNSSYFGLSREIVSPKDAVIHLGLDVIKSLVLSIKLFSVFSETRDINKIWHHSQSVANTAKKIARYEGFSDKCADQLYCAGLLQDVGELIIFEHERKINEASETSQPPISVDVPHEKVTVYLMHIWGLPAVISECVAYHHDYERFAGEEVSLPMILCCTNHIVSNVFENQQDNAEILIESGVISKQKLAEWINL